jgi:IS605 OrfB family transposase
MAIQVTRTQVGHITNHQQVQGDLNALGDAASKLWNVARWTADRVWNAIGEIPSEASLKAYMKTRQCWKNLNAFSSQAIIEELSDAFQSWFDVRHKDETANPPGYRKEYDTRPRSTVTFKDNGFKLDTKHDQVRLSKGENLKDGFGDFVLCEFETRNDVALSDVDTVQNVRAVWNGDQWEVHFVVKESIEIPYSPGDGVAGVDLGVSNIAAVAFPDEYVLYPGNTIKQDNHYFQQREYDTEGENGPSQQAKQLRKKRNRRETHFYHTLTKTIIEKCVKRGVGTLVVGWPEDVRSDDLGKTANKWLHTWAFDRLYQYLNYKGEERGIEVLKENEWNTSKTCCKCGDTADSNRVERGLYVCDSCGLVANADCNGAENIRQKITPSPAVDRSTGCLAQPSVYLFDTSTGEIAPQEQVVP